MRKNFDEIIELSLQKEFDEIDCPDPEKELITFNIKLCKRTRMEKIRTMASVCAVLLIIPLILLLYTTKSKPDDVSKNLIMQKTRNDLIKESSIIVSGTVTKITPLANAKEIEISIDEIFKGIPNKDVILVRVDDIRFETDEKVILFLNAKEKSKKYYTITGSCLGKYTLKNSEKKIFENCYSSEEIKLSSFKDEVSNN
jgi:hypothetical protein